MPININAIRYPKGLCYIKPCAWDIGTRFGASCPQTCLSVTASGDLPDPAGDCTFAQVRESSDNEVIVTLVEWDGASWVLLASVRTINAGAVIDSADYRTYGTWTATINGASVSGVGLVDFDPDATEVDVVFINGACSYAMDTIYPTSSLVLAYDDIINAPVADPNDVAQWNAYFLSAGDYSNYLSVSVNGNDVYLTSYTGITAASVVNNQSGLLYVTDNGIFSHLTYVFAIFCPDLILASSSSLLTTESLIDSCPLLTQVNFPLLQEVTTAFGDCFAISSVSFPSLLIMRGGENFNQGVFYNIEMPVLQQLGNSVGDDNVFGTMAVCSAITLPVALATVNGGNPDGDITFAITNWGATITYV